jgi:hypothetical protein
MEEEEACIARSSADPVVAPIRQRNSLRDLDEPIVQ